MGGQTAWDHVPFAQQVEMQDKKIRSFIQGVARYHPFYKHLMRQQQLDPLDLRGVDDFVKRFPFTTKNDVAPKPDNPFVPMEFVMLDPDDLSRSQPRFMIATTGRTALNTPFWYTNWDLENVLGENTRRIAEVLGLRADDTIVNAFPFAPHLAFWAGYYMSTGQSLTAIHTGGGKIMGTQRIVDTAFATKASVLLAVPGYALHLLRTALAAEKYLDHVRLLLTGGDRLPKSFRENLLEILDAMSAPEPTISAAYGFTEARMAPVECPHRTEMTGYHTSPDMEIWYTIDPTTGERVGPGDPGELVWTPLQGWGTVVMNYRTGDYAEGGIRYESCPFCGRTVPIIDSLISRASEQKTLNLTKVKGTLVDLNQFYTILPSIREIEEWQVVLKKPEGDPLGPDELHLFVSLRRGRGLRNQQTTIKVLERVMQESLEVAPTAVHVQTLDQITRALGMETQLKELRVLDLRPKV